MTKPITFQISNATSEVANSLPIDADFEVLYESDCYYILSAGEKIKLINGLIFKHTEYILKIKSIEEAEPVEVEPNLSSQFLFTEGKQLSVEFDDTTFPIAALNHAEHHHELNTLFSHDYTSSENELSFLFGNQPNQAKIRTSASKSQDVMLYAHDLHTLLNQHFSPPQHATASIEEALYKDDVLEDEENILYDLGFEHANGARHSNQMQLNSLQTHKRNFIFGYIEDTGTTLPISIKSEEPQQSVSTWLKRLFSFNS